MTITLDKKLRDFFEYDVFGDDEEVDSFLSQYNCESVIQCLFEKLKIIAASRDNTEPAWRLGRAFAAITERYSADTKIYSLLGKSNSIFEKMAFLNFLSGYWDGAKPDLETVIELSNVVSKSISSSELKWTGELGFWGIEAVLTGYCRYSDRSEIDLKVKNDFKEKLKLFEVYLLDLSVNYSYAKQTLDFVQSILKK